jgi:excisionase family DNA binding protein
MKKMRSLGAVANSQEGQPLGAVSTIEEVAEFLRMRPAQVRELLRRRCARPIPVLRAGRHLRFDLRAVAEWLRQKPTGASPKL